MISRTQLHGPRSVESSDLGSASNSMNLETSSQIESDNQYHITVRIRGDQGSKARLGLEVLLSFLSLKTTRKVAPSNRDNQTTVVCIPIHAALFP
jgi:hypothetical protein